MCIVVGNTFVILHNVLPLTPVMFIVSVYIMMVPSTVVR